MITDIDAARRTAAEAAYEAYDFEELVIETATGWEFASGAAAHEEWVRSVFYEDPKGSETGTVSFVVRFGAGNAVIEEAYATLDGSEFGARGDVEAKGPAL